MSRILPLCIVVFLCFSGGCASTGREKPRVLESTLADNRVLPSVLFGNVFTKKQSENVPVTKTGKSVGFNLLEDTRPSEDVHFMTSVREKVSERVFGVLQDVNLFGQFTVPASSDNDFVIQGSIQRFSWDSYDTAMSYIPVMNVFTFFGLPSARTRCEVQIYLEMKNVKTNEIVFGITETYKTETSYSIYSFKADKGDKDLARCFDVVLKRLKGKIFLYRERITEALKSDVALTPQPPVREQANAASEKNLLSTNDVKVDASNPQTAVTPGAVQSDSSRDLSIKGALDDMANPAPAQQQK